MILLSVITICFNNPGDLADTCASVDQQSEKPGEHLIIDGSTDENIVQWLMNNAQPSYRRWIHEPDSGISDAFNKGILNSKGDIIHLLNSGDRYATGTAIETVMAFFREDSSLQWTHSQYIQYRGEMDVVSGLPFESEKLWKGMRTVAHPTMFIRREVYSRNGFYDKEYKIAMDFDMLVRMRQEKFRFIPSSLVYFAPGGASNTQFEKGLAEVKRSYKRHIGSSMLLAGWQLRQRLLHAFMQTNLGKSWFRRKNQRNKR